MYRTNRRRLPARKAWHVLAVAGVLAIAGTVTAFNSPTAYADHRGYCFYNSTDLPFRYGVDRLPVMTNQDGCFSQLEVNQIVSSGMLDDALSRR
jgi:hypothetical protein